MIVVGCVEVSGIGENDIKLIENIPVTANTPNAFSYVVRANAFSQQINSSLSFDTATFITAVVVGAYAQGTLSLTVYNEDSTKSYNQTITSDMIFSDFPTFHATALELKLQEFSGSVDLVVTVGD